MRKIFLLTAVSLFLAPVFVFASFDNNLGYGSIGQGVTELQEFLLAQGVYDGPVTGNFYSLTLGGVKAFQVREGISPVSGFFGPLTRARANGLLEAVPPPLSGSVSESPAQKLAELLQQLTAIQ
ncbi:MAG: hypothetical protein G01um1014107_363, partial [Parcubacteria group bacterium Gr01-1014_107]